VAIVAVKMSEDGTDLILRGYETQGRDVRAQVSVGLESTVGDAISGSFVWRAHEIKTLRLVQAQSRLVQVDIMEEPSLPEDVGG
jgi:hypothetical protein